MKRRLLIIALSAACLAPAGASAQGYADQIVQQLRDQGYGGIAVNGTWLGRTRIVAQSGNGSREIIIDPRTGEILRDLFTGSGSGNTSGPRIVDDRPTTPSSSGGNDDDDADDDEEEDEDEDEDEDDQDNSGSGNGGGGNSGSGGDNDPDDDADEDDEDEND